MGAVVLQDDESEFATVPVGFWKPDVPAPSNDGMLSALNLVPKPNGFYAPERAFADVTTESITPFGNALKAHGSFHSVPADLGGTPRYYVGTFATAAGDSRILSQLEGAAFSDLSKVGGYTANAFTPWRFANFGNLVFAANRGTRLQSSAGGAATFADVTDAPQITDIAEVNGFLVGVTVIDLAYGEGTQNFRVWWSAAGDGENWPDPTSDEAITTQSGFQDLLGGGPLEAIVPGIGGSDAVIVASRKMWRMNYVGPPSIWQFDEIESDQGTEIIGSIAVYNQSFFFRGQNSFYWFDGQNSTNISAGVFDDFFADDVQYSIDFGFQRNSTSAIDTINKNYVFAYRSVNAPDERCDRILRYNWVTGAWSNSDVQVDVMGNMDSVRSGTDATVFYIMDSTFQTKEPDGATLQVDLELREQMRGDGARSRIKSVLPLIDSELVTAKICTRDVLYKDPVDSVIRTWNNHGLIRFDPTVVTGRFFRCCLSIPAGDDWNNLQGVQYETTPWSHGPAVPTS